MKRFHLTLVAMSIVLANQVSADQPSVAESPTSTLKAVKVTKAWGPKFGPDGTVKSAVTAVLPKQILDKILDDVSAWYAGSLPPEARKGVVDKVVKERIEGRGPSAWFDRKRTKDGGIDISKPQSSTKYEVMGGEDIGFEIGIWQPPATPGLAIENGYRWKLTWMTQVGTGNLRRRYRVDVDLTGTIDLESGGILYKATWHGPFAEKPVDIRKVPEQQRKQ